MARKVLSCIGNHLTIPHAIVDGRNGAERLTIILCDTEADLLSDDDITFGDIAIVKDPLGVYVGMDGFGYQRLESWPVGACIVMADGIDPSEAIGFGTWVSIKSWGILDVWKRTA